ncbi:MAG: helix-turn-helix domain-containing protein [Clostridiales bacterium]|jgi:transcriptional regulator with XRE-family HTH domain|nr:helix-turn-helix domain-containing protein [Clostridiales bacterium]
MRLYSTKKGILCYIFGMTHWEDIHKNLREAIQLCGMPQKEIAKRLGINPSTLSKYTRLNVFPALDTFAELCQILDVSADDILGIRE